MVFHSVTCDELKGHLAPVEKRKPVSRHVPRRGELRTSDTVTKGVELVERLMKLLGKSSGRTRLAWNGKSQVCRASSDPATTTSAFFADNDVGPKPIAGNHISTSGNVTKTSQFHLKQITKLLEVAPEPAARFAVSTGLCYPNGPDTEPPIRGTHGKRTTKVIAEASRRRKHCPDRVRRHRNGWHRAASPYHSDCRGRR